MAWKKSGFNTCSLCEDEGDVGKVSTGAFSSKFICGDCYDLVEDELFKVNKKTLNEAKYDENVQKKIKERKKAAPKVETAPAAKSPDLDIEKTRLIIKKKVPKPTPVQEKMVPKVENTAPEVPSENGDRSEVIKNIRTHLERVTELLEKVK